MNSSLVMSHEVRAGQRDLTPGRSQPWSALAHQAVTALRALPAPG
jgi:hypothetical protein